MACSSSAPSQQRPGLSRSRSPSRRHHATTSDEQAVEAALGFTRWQRTLARLLPTTVAASLAALLTITGGLVSGAVEPMGGVRRLEPSPGWAPHLALIGLGVLVIVALLAAVSALTAAIAGRRRTRAGRCVLAGWPTGWLPSGRGRLRSSA